MGRTENIRDIAIAITSTSALLLTILAVGRVPAKSGLGNIAATAAVMGFYFSIGFGAVVMLAVVAEPRNPLRRSLFRGAFFLEFIFFLVGLIGIVGVIVFQIRTA